MAVELEVLLKRRRSRSRRVTPEHGRRVRQDRVAIPAVRRIVADDSPPVYCVSIVSTVPCVVIVVVRQDLCRLPVASPVHSDKIPAR